jgi:hypothetical protein
MEETFGSDRKNKKHMQNLVRRPPENDRFEVEKQNENNIKIDIT